MSMEMYNYQVCNLQKDFCQEECSIKETINSFEVLFTHILNNDTMMQYCTSSHKVEKRTFKILKRYRDEIRTLGISYEI